MPIAPFSGEIITRSDHSALSKAMKKAIDRENRALIEAEADALVLKLTIDGAGTVWTATPPA